MPADDTVTIAGRFNGPPGSANGGYACGLVAAAIGPAAQVRLALPPPLDTPLTRHADAGGVVRLLDGEALVAEGRHGEPQVAVPPAPSLKDAERASRAYTGHDPAEHAFPTCFVCGPLRPEDGLHVFPGPVGGGDVLACPWRPRAEHAGGEGTVDPLFVWAALDCPSGFACIPRRTRTVLASMTARLEGPAHPGETYVVTSWRLGSEGRKHRAGSAVHALDGRRVAVAEALWITLRD